MNLFSVPDRKRVRLTSARIRWAKIGMPVEVLGYSVTWTGVTSGSYWTYEGVKRRLLLEHTLGLEIGVWQRDVECVILESSLVD